MSQNKRQLIQIVTALVTMALSFWAWWWTSHNILPDGYQNEYLHVGNAFDLWEAWRAGDLWHLRYYMYTRYWPFGFYMVPWPMAAIFGMHSSTLVLSNVVWFVFLIWSVNQLTKDESSAAIPLLVMFTPAVYGTLVRYEPNLANIAWVAVGILCLVKSQQFQNRTWVRLWAICLGLGLMTDRLSVGFYLVPAALPCLWMGRHAPQFRRNLLEAMGIVLLLTFAYYREFFIQNTEEVFGQAPVGEIDSKGMVTEPDVGFRPLYYLWVLLDSQAGPFVGLVLVVGWIRTVRDWWRFGIPFRAVILLFASLPGILFFTVLAKKQLYYTLPAIVPLILLANMGRLAWLGVVGGLIGFVSLGLGIGSFGGTWLPDQWVAPRHVLIRPPSQYTWTPEDLAAVLPENATEVHLLSLDETLYEGYLALLLREQRPETRFRGVTLDPMGVREFWPQADYFLFLTSGLKSWPSQSQIEDELKQDYGIEKASHFPPIGAKIARESEKFQLVSQADFEQGTLWCYKRIGPSSLRDDD